VSLFLNTGGVVIRLMLSNAINDDLGIVLLIASPATAGVAGVLASPDPANLIVLGAVVDDFRAASNCRLFLASSSCTSALTEAKVRFFNDPSFAVLPVVVFPFPDGFSAVAHGGSPSSSPESVLELEVLAEASALVFLVALSEVAGGFPSSS
jgi:hypothetical protein